MSSWIERRHQYHEYNPGQNLIAPVIKETGLLKPRALTKTGKRRNGGKPRMSDDDIKAIIREFHTGKSLAILEKKHGIWAETIRHWVQGVNRKHLLAEVEKEMRK